MVRFLFIWFDFLGLANSGVDLVGVVAEHVFGDGAEPELVIVGLAVELGDFVVGAIVDRGVAYYLQK